MKRKVTKELLSPEQNEIMRRAEYMEVENRRRQFAVDLAGMFCFGGLFIGTVMILAAVWP
jgi:hypothetical protein